MNAIYDEIIKKFIDYTKEKVKKKKGEDVLEAAKYSYYMDIVAAVLITCIAVQPPFPLPKQDFVISFAMWIIYAFTCGGTFFAAWKQEHRGLSKEEYRERKDIEKDKSYNNDVDYLDRTIEEVLQNRKRSKIDKKQFLILFGNYCKYEYRKKKADFWIPFINTVLMAFVYPSIVSIFTDGHVRLFILLLSLGVIASCPVYVIIHGFQKNKEKRYQTFNGYIDEIILKLETENSKSSNNAYSEIWLPDLEIWLPDSIQKTIDKNDI